MIENREQPDRDQLEREASEWLARVHSDDASAEVWNGFSVWYLGDPARARVYDELFSTWTALNEMGPEPEWKPSH